MNLTNLFSNKSRKDKNMNTSNVDLQNAGQDDTIVSQNLFVDTEPPVVSITTKKESLLQIFLAKNYEMIGFNEGYRSGYAETQQMILAQIKADFSLTLDKEMDRIRKDVNEVKLYIIKITGLSEVLEKQAAEKLQQLESQIRELDTQKVLAVGDNGFIAAPVANFKSGFLRGVEQYQMEKLFASSTGLFNN
jgi:hypothetical protein